MSQWIGRGKKASDGWGAGKGIANGEEEPWNGINTCISGISAMTVSTRIMVRIGKEEMTSKLKGNEHRRPVAHFTFNISKALLFSFSSLGLGINEYFFGFNLSIFFG